MFYFDTSFIIPFFFPEPSSKQVETKLLSFQPGELAISLWTKTEFVSAMALKVRDRSISKNLAGELIAKFEQTVVETFHIISPVDADFHLASRFLEHFTSGLRSGDALHLAIAQNHGAQKFYTLDEGLLRAARSLKIPAFGLKKI